VTILFCILAVLIPALLITGVNILEDYKLKRMTMESDKRHRELEAVPEKYDPHYTRDLEIEGGIKAATQCDNTNCRKCYWKPRMLTKHEDKLHGHISLLRDRDAFIESLPDDMSDDMYDFLYQDWLEEQLPLVNKIEARRAKELAEKAKREDEKYYATPYHLIQQYKAEGREFSKQANSWGPASNKKLPRPPKPSKGGPTSAMSNSEFSQKLAELRKTMDKINEDIAKAKLATYDYKRNKSI
jgi:hypothetical protein